MAHEPYSRCISLPVQSKWPSNVEVWPAAVWRPFFPAGWSAARPFFLGGATFVSAATGSGGGAVDKTAGAARRLFERGSSTSVGRATRARLASSRRDMDAPFDSHTPPPLRGRADERWAIFKKKIFLYSLE